MELRRLVLEDNEGQVQRAFAWQGDDCQIVRRGDTHRLEIVRSTSALEKQKIPFENLGNITSQMAPGSKIKIGQLGHLQFVENIQRVGIDTAVEETSNKNVTRGILAFVALLAVGIVALLHSRPVVTANMENDLKQQLVKIETKFRKAVPPVEKVSMTAVPKTVEPLAATPVKREQALKRMGALAVLGSLNKSRQRGGLNLAAVETSAGPGLGGRQGSGGVQTSIYSKGLMAAPVGAGGNVQGAGGYGTKGKGGGQAGYGTLSLVGATGASPLPLTQEATVASGLDRDQIAEVINRNLGQVRFCYEQGLQSDASLTGRVAIDFTIGANGLVKAADIANSTLKSAAVEGCLMARLKSWKFPLPQGGVDVKVSYPFVLRRAGQG